MFLTRLAPAIACLCILSGVSRAQTPTPTPTAEIDAAMLRQDFAGAVKLLDAELGKSDKASREELLYRRGLALYYDGKHSDAIAAFSAQLGEFPAGSWADKARFRIADAHVALRQFDEAEPIYAERVTALVGGARRSRIAKLYVDFAGEYFQPTDKLTRPDYARARTFLQKAVEFEPEESVREEAMYRAALCTQKLGEHPAAAEQFHAYLVVFDADYRQALKQRPGVAALPAPASADGAHRVEARLGLADSRLACGQPVDARRDYQDLIALLRKLDPDHANSRDTWAKAHRGLARSYGMPQPGDAGNLALGVGALEEVIASSPQSVDAVHAAYDIGAAYFHLGRDDEAILALRSCVDRARIKPAGDEAESLADNRGQEALHTIGLAFARQRKHADVIKTGEEYLRRFPNGPHWSDAQQSMVTAEFNQGIDQLADKDYAAAKASLAQFLERYPLDGRAAQTMLRLAEIEQRMQQRNEEEKKPVDWTSTIEQCRKLVSKYPNTEESGAAQLMLAGILADKLGDLEGAFAEYSKLTWSSSAPVAQHRLAEMRATRLSVLVPRVFRTNEPAKVKVDTRNVDTLTVKLYRLDMEDYFRKTHALGGVERLDLALIDPDQTLQIPVKEYGKYKPIAQEIEIPIEGPGVLAVSITNETSRLTEVRGVDHQKLEATALLIRSDIEIIVKSSRRQVLAYAQNMVTQTPVAGVDLLVTDGAKTVLSGRTGDDGAWLAKSDALKSIESLSVLAKHDGHVAGTGVSLSGLTFSTGLAPRGYIHTDRPAYLPGSAVNIRGILREVADGRYSLPAQPEDPLLAWKLDVIDPSGRVLTTLQPSVSEFGSFAAQFRVADDGAIGQYRLIARRPNGPSFDGSFTVAKYELPKAYLEFDLAERVLLRGETIRGAIVAKYQYGEPVVGKVIQYTFTTPTGDVVQRAGTTDAKGRVEIEFDTSRVPEEGYVSIGAIQAELGLMFTESVRIATRAFRAEISTRRPLYLTDEPIEAQLRAFDLKDKPTAAEMTVTALRRIRTHDRWSETRVAEQPARADAEKGLASATFKFEKGGEYVLRAEGKDRFGRTVSAECVVAVSDNEDATKVRVFSDRETYKVGETIALDVHSRLTNEGAAGVAGRPGHRALLTFEAEEITGYKTVWVEPGHNKLEVPVGHEHFPNFAVGVSVMAGSKFHEASREFYVQRQLKISIKPARDTYRPRDSMKLDIAVTDHLDKPVKAEVGLSIIDMALLGRFADQAPPIVDFFESQARRSASLRAQSSCTYRHVESGRRMVTDVLAEAERVEDIAKDRLARLVDAAGEPPALGSLGPAAQPPTSAGRPVGGRGERQSGQMAGGGREPARARVARLDASNSVLTTGTPQDAQQLAEGLAVQEIALGVAMFQTAESDAPERSIQQQLGKQHAVDALDAWRGKAFIASELGYKDFTASCNSIVEQAPRGTYFPEVAYWNPRIATDDDGKASLEITLPDSTTRWRIIGRGVTADTIVGEATAEFVTRDEFFVELLAPSNVIQDDTFVPTVRVHCLADYAGDVDVQLTVVRGGQVEAAPLAQVTKRVKIEGKGVVEATFDAIRAAGDGRLELSARATTLSPVKDAGRQLEAVASRTVLITPWGMRLDAHVAGAGRDSDFVEVELPAAPPGGSYHSRRLTIAVGPSMPRWIIDEALESGPRWESIDAKLSCLRVIAPRTTADTASTLVGALYAWNYARSRDHDDPSSVDVPLLRERIAGLVAQLVATQQQDGGWPWSGGAGKPSNLWTSSQVAWALGRAKRDGATVGDDVCNRLAAYLQKGFADARPDQTELKAAMLFGLSWLGEVDFAHVNRLHRNRQSLNAAALAQLAVTLVNLDRKPMAMELLSDLEKRLVESGGARGGSKKVPADNCSMWMASDLEITALTLLAQVQVDPRASSVAQMVAHLTRAARADGWNPHKARGAVLAALATYFGGARQDAAAFTLNVSVNGKELLKLTPDTKTCQRLDLPEHLLADGKQRVDFTFAGRGDYAYSVEYSGFATEFPPHRHRGNDPFWGDVRWYAPPPIEYKGRPLVFGFGVTHRSNWFVNRVSNIQQGKVVRTRVNLVRNYDLSRSPAGDADYIVVQESVPAGFALLPDSVRGDFLAQEFSDGVITLYYGSESGLGTLEYDMVATTPGTYRAAPTILRSLYHPQRVNVIRADEITVLPRGATSPDPYRMSPDELYHLARWHFDDGDFERPAELLRELLAAQDWALHDEPYRETIRMLLACALKRGVADDVVNYFEILKEKYPDLLVRFEDIVQVAQAYRKTNQAERAYLIYRAVADTAFGEDAAVAGVLQNEGRFFAGVDFLESLWREYPDTPQVESTFFALSQSVYGSCDRAASLRPRDASASRVTRADIVRETVRFLERFLSLYPTSPIADEAAFSLANAYLDLDRFDEVIRRTDEFIARFTKSKWLDRYRYIQALAQFNLGRFDQAQALAEHVASATYRDEQGVERPSPNKWLAIYILGQIAHAQGAKAKALEYYKQVKEHFSDASEAIEYFEHKLVKLPELVVFHPDGDGYREASEWEQHLRRSTSLAPPAAAMSTNGHGEELRGGSAALAASQTRGAAGAAAASAPLYARPFVELAHRNVKQAVIQVYRVDLMKLLLIEKNPAAIASVNLAGIKPLVETTIALGDGLDYVDRSTRVDLDLIRRAAAADAKRDATGAYLIMCRADDLFTSGLVLVTPIALDVQREPGAGRVRVNVVNAIDRGGAKSVHVKVIGLGMSEFVSGETDLRGVYVADGVNGHPSAIARDQAGHVALFRSEEALLALAAASMEKPGQAKAPAPGEKADYRKNLMEENRGLQTDNDAKLKELYNQQQRRGVEVKKAQ